MDGDTHIMVMDGDILITMSIMEIIIILIIITTITIMGFPITEDAEIQIMHVQVCGADPAMQPLEIHTAVQNFPVV